MINLWTIIIVSVVALLSGLLIAGIVYLIKLAHAGWDAQRKFAKKEGILENNTKGIKDAYREKSKQRGDDTVPRPSEPTTEEGQDPKKGL